MKKYTWLLLSLLYCNFSRAQADLRFELMEQTTFTAFSDTGCKAKFGGISAIEMMPGTAAPHNPQDKVSRQLSLYLISDHYPNKRGTAVQQYSYCFPMDNHNKVYAPSVFFGQNSIESVRYNESLGKVFYSYETDDHTGIGFINSGTAHILFEEPIPSDNRGIEGITFTKDNCLWAVCESGEKQSCGYTVPFYCFPPDSTGNSYYNMNARIEYQYPFDRCSCMNADCNFNGRTGNGISEILALKNRKDSILVLERCFDGTSSHIRLFLATVEAGSRILTKQLVFDFNNNTAFKIKDKAFIPDNLEGMAWGRDERGTPVLYLVSDDNFNYPRQHSQIIKLRMITR